LPRSRTFLPAATLLGLLAAACEPGSGEFDDDAADDDAADDDAADDDAADDDAADDDATEDDDSTPAPDPCEGVDPVSGTGVQFDKVATGLDFPVAIVQHPTDPAVLLVLQQEGEVVALRASGSGEYEDAGSFVDIRDRVDFGGEAGLLGMAFSPGFADDGRFYLHYDRPGGPVFTSVISEFSVVAGDPLTGDPDSERELLTQQQPYSNHNGGAIEFGPDGMLYIGLGDGGDANDRACAGSDGTTFLAKILRIDPTPSGSDPYTVPDDNPFVGDPDMLPETWAWGLRNPWKFTFDRVTGEMFIADVGQNEWEEIDLGQPGAHYGWSAREGAHDFSNSCDNLDSGWVDPVWEYRHTAMGGSVSGGYVYRGCKMPDLDGKYFYAEAVQGTATRLDWDGTSMSGAEQIWSGQGYYQLVAWGEDFQGELYVARYQEGAIYKMVPE